MARLARLASPRQPKGESASVALARAESAASAASEKYEALSKTMRENSCEWEARYHALAKSIRDRNERFLPSSASQTDWDGSSIDGAIGEAKKWKAECETLAAELKRLSAAAAESEARRKAAQEALREAEKKLDEEMQRRREAERAERAARRAFEDLESSEADARRELATAQHAAEREMAVAKHAIELSQVEVAEARREATRAAASAARVAAQARDDAMGRAHTRMVSPRRVAAKFEARRATAQEQFQRLVEHAEHSRELATAMVRPSARAPHPDSTITYPGRLPSLTLGVASIRTIPCGIASCTRSAARRHIALLACLRATSWRQPHARTKHTHWRQRQRRRSPTMMGALTMTSLQHLVDVGSSGSATHHRAWTIHVRNGMGRSVASIVAFLAALLGHLQQQGAPPKR